MKNVTYNAGNAGKRKLKRDLRRLLAPRRRFIVAGRRRTPPLVLGLVEVHDRRDVLRWAAERFGYRLFQYDDAARGHCAILARHDAHARHFRHHKINDRTFVGRDVAGAADTGYSAEKHIIAIDVTGPNGRDATAAVWHLVPSASHSEKASALLELQAKAGASWLRQQDLPTDLMGDINGRYSRPEFKALRPVVAAALGAPSRKGDPIDWHLLTQGSGTAVALDGYSSDHKPVEADIDWHHDDVRRAA